MTTSLMLFLLNKFPGKKAGYEFPANCRRPTSIPPAAPFTKVAPKTSLSEGRGTPTHPMMLLTREVLSVVTRTSKFYGFLPLWL